MEEQVGLTKEGAVERFGGFWCDGAGVGVGRWVGGGGR